MGLVVAIVLQTFENMQFASMQTVPGSTYI